eukprot:gene30217-35205_t
MVVSNQKGRNADGSKLSWNQFQSIYKGHKELSTAWKEYKVSGAVPESQATKANHHGDVQDQGPCTTSCRTSAPPTSRDQASCTAFYRTSDPPPSRTSCNLDACTSPLLMGPCTASCSTAAPQPLRPSCTLNNSGPPKAPGQKMSWNVFQSTFKGAFSQSELSAAWASYRINGITPDLVERMKEPKKATTVLGGNGTSTRPMPTAPTHTLVPSVQQWAWVNGHGAPAATVLGDDGTSTRPMPTAPTHTLVPSEQQWAWVSGHWVPAATVLGEKRADLRSATSILVDDDTDPKTATHTLVGGTTNFKTATHMLMGGSTDLKTAKAATVQLAPRHKQLYRDITDLSRELDQQRTGTQGKPTSTLSHLPSTRLIPTAPTHTLIPSVTPYSPPLPPAMVDLATSVCSFPATSPISAPATHPTTTSIQPGAPPLSPTMEDLVSSVFSSPATRPIPAPATHPTTTPIKPESPSRYPEIIDLDYSAPSSPETSPTPIVIPTASLSTSSSSSDTFCSLPLMAQFIAQTVVFSPTSTAAQVRAEEVAPPPRACSLSVSDLS